MQKHVAMALILAGYLCGCASYSPKMESASVATRLGYPHCKVSVPMSQDEVIASERWRGDPITETRDEWTTILAATQPGDQLRLVDCVRPDSRGIAVGYYFYGLFRGQNIVAKLSGPIIN